MWQITNTLESHSMSGTRQLTKSPEALSLSLSLSLSACWFSVFTHVERQTFIHHVKKRNILPRPFEKEFADVFVLRVLNSISRRRTRNARWSSVVADSPGRLAVVQRETKWNAVETTSSTAVSVAEYWCALIRGCPSIVRAVWWHSLWHLLLIYVAHNLVSNDEVVTSVNECDWVAHEEIGPLLCWVNYSSRWSDVDLDDCPSV